MRHQELNPPAIVKTAMPLEEELAQKIKKREEEIVKTTLEHARLQGADLLRARQHLGKRKFAPWLSANFRFSRQTAYTYMKVASKWETICQGALQMGSLQQVVQKLFRERKAKKNSKPGSAPETDPTKSRQVKKPSTESMPGEDIETPSDSEQVEHHEPDQDDLTPDPEQEEKPDEETRGTDAAEGEEKPDKETPKKSHRNSSQASSEGATNNAINNFVILIRDPRVNEYLQGMMGDLLEEHRNQGFFDHIHPEEIRGVVQQENAEARIIMALMQFAVDRQRRLQQIQKRGNQEAK